MEPDSANLARRTLLLALAATALAGASAPARPAVADPRDLTGVWTNASWTRLQRPKGAAGLVTTEADGRKLWASTLGEFLKHDELGQATSEFNDWGDDWARVKGQLRTSWIVDPADGRLPYTEAVKKARMADPGSDGPGDYDDVKRRPTGERCLTADGAGAPILNSPDTNLVTLVLTKDALVIVSEKNHDARIVRLGAPPPGPREPRSWMGTSIGHWEGATLVVETTHLRAGLTRLTSDLVLSDQARVTERFTRTGPDEIEYDFAVDDPAVFSRPWRAEMAFHRSTKPMYEYACHEGNYSLPAILAGGQKAEADARAAKGQYAPRSSPRR